MSIKFRSGHLNQITSLIPCVTPKSSRCLDIPGLDYSDHCLFFRWTRHRNLCVAYLDAHTMQITAILCSILCRRRGATVSFKYGSREFHAGGVRLDLWFAEGVGDDVNCFLDLTLAQCVSHGLHQSAVLLRYDVHVHGEYGSDSLCSHYGLTGHISMIM